MPTFTNTSTSVFQDGDLIVTPGESFSTDQDFRIEQMRGAYAWQFSESDKDAPTEAEVEAHPEAKDVREIRDASHVALDEDGKQSEVVGSPEPAETADAADEKPAKKK